MGPVRTGSFHVDVAGGLERIRYGWIQKVSYRIYRWFIPVDHLLQSIRFAVLTRGFGEYGTPREILTDHGTQFVSAWDRELSHHTFKEFLDHHGIKHIVARVKHPQTNGKIERFFGEVERRIRRIGSIDEIVQWHNVIKPHMSLDYDEPFNVFWYRLPPETILAYAQKWLYV